MKQRMALTLLLLLGLDACGGGGSSSTLPVSNQTTLAIPGSVVTTSALTRRRATAALSYSYSAPWGGFGAPGSIYVLGQGACNDIPATLANGASWPTFLNNLAAGTKVTIFGTPSYDDAWSQAHNCPTGGIVATSVVLGTGPTPTPSPTTSPIGTGTISINAGGTAGGVWVADTDFSSGSYAISTHAAINMNNVASPAPLSVYQTYRYASRLTYAISNFTPLAPYAVRLHFAETFFNAANKRVFGATINGVPVLSNFDIFAAAGGENIAIVKQYNAKADATGKITIAFSASVNNALISGIQIAPGSVGPTPSPSPSPSPTSTPQSQYPLYSALFTAPNNPFHMTYEALRALPNQAQQPASAASMSNNLWNQGAGNYQTVAAFPIYQGKVSDPAYVVSCLAYSNNGCGAQGKTVHLPTGWTVQPGTDHHVTIIDMPNGHEDDLWGGYNDGNYNGPYPCNVISGNTLNCSWGGDYAFNTKGLQATNNNGSGVAGGMAEGLFEITAGDLLSAGPIGHALGIQAACLDNDSSEGTGGAVYPSSRQTATDNPCSNYGMPSGAPPYGAMWHVKSSVNVASLGYGPYCTKIVQAMQTYGMYLMDSGNGQDQLEVENPISYNGAPYTSNPFYKTIWPSMVGSGDGTGSETGFAFGGCFNRLNANDMEIYYAPTSLGF